MIDYSQKKMAKDKQMTVMQVENFSIVQKNENSVRGSQQEVTESVTSPTLTVISPTRRPSNTTVRCERA